MLGLVSLWTLLLIVAGVALALYCAFAAALLLTGRRTDARAWAGFVPDCLVRVGRLLKDPSLSRREKLPLGLLMVYLVLPFDLIPTSFRSRDSSMSPSSLPGFFAAWRAAGPR